MKITTRALVALLASGAAAYGMAAPAQAAPKQAAATDTSKLQPSKGALNALADLKKAVDAKDQASIPAKLAAAQAASTTREDKFILAQLQLKAAVNANDLASASSAIDALAASGFLDNETVAKYYHGIAGSFYNAKQYTQAAADYQRAVALNPHDLDSLKMIAETNVAEGKDADAAPFFQRTIQATLAAGQKPDEELYKRAVQVAYLAKLPSAVDLSREWLSAYPNPESWRNSIAIYRNLSHPDPDSALDLMRLMRVTGTMVDPVDFSTYLYALNSQSNFIEAQTALEKPGSVNLSSPEVSEIAANLKSKPRVTAADLSAAVKTAPTGQALLHIGDRFYGLGDYAKAVEIYKQSQAKGIDPNLVSERVGVALAGAGDKAGATAAFKSITGPRSGVAQFWLLYLQQA